MSIDLRPVWVIQRRSSGSFLHLELYEVRSLKNAGRAPDYDCAVETAQLNLPDGDWEIHQFFEPVGAS
jgi:hypothetical protein